jgi:hypothetical protein
MAHQTSVWGTLEAGGGQEARPRKRWIWAFPILIVALSGAAALWYYYPLWNSQSPSTPVRADLALTLQRAGSDYRVTWDAASPVVQAGRRGALLIKDGGFEKELELNREQLLSAGVVYSPATADVSFRLKVFGPGAEPAIASIRLLAGSRPEMAQEAPPVETALPPVVSPPQNLDQPAASLDQPNPEAPATIAQAPISSEAPQSSR